MLVRTNLVTKSCSVHGRTQLTGCKFLAEMDRNGRDDNWNLRSDRLAHLLSLVFVLCGFASSVTVQRT